MSQFFDKRDVQEAVVAVLNRAMTPEEAERFEATWKTMTDPRRGHRIINHLVDTLSYLDGNYTICRFVGGYGFSHKECGGVSAYVEPEVIKQMIAQGWVSPGNHRITYQGNRASAARRFGFEKANPG